MAHDFGTEISENAREPGIAYVHARETRALRDILTAPSAMFPQRIDHKYLMPRRHVRIDDV